MERPGNEVFFALRKKEAELSELFKINEKLKTENEVLRERLVEKEYKSKRIEEELNGFKAKVKELQAVCRSSGNFDLPGEYLKLKEEMRKVKEAFRSSRIEYEGRIVELEEKIEQISEDSKGKIDQMKEEVIRTSEQSAAGKGLGDELLRKIQEQFVEIGRLKQELDETHDELAVVKQENLILIEENLALNQQKKSQEDFKAEKEVVKLLKSARECLRRVLELKGKQVYFEELAQEGNMILAICECKGVINELMQEIIEFQAENVSDKACTPQ